MKPSHLMLPALLMGVILAIMFYCFIQQRESRNLPHSRQIATDFSSISNTKNPQTAEPSYSIFNKEESYCRVKSGQSYLLKDYYISLASAETASNQIERIATNIAAKEKDVSALNVYFFWPGTEKEKAYTAAMATLAPNGRWEDFEKSAPKKLVFKYGQPKTFTTSLNRTEFGFQLALSTRKQIFWHLLEEEDRAGIAGDYEQCKRVIADRYGISVHEVARIQVEGVDNRWPMPEDTKY